MRGIATDPYLAHCPPSDARYYPIYAKCVELGVPVFVTTAPPAQVPRAIMDYIDPRQIDVVARDFPELILIMSHGGYPFVNEAIFACMRNANVYMDLSEYELAPMAEVYVDALNKMIGDKVIFASAHRSSNRPTLSRSTRISTSAKKSAKRSCTRPPRRSSASTRAFPSIP